MLPPLLVPALLAAAHPAIPEPGPAVPGMRRVARGVWVGRLAPGVWAHTTVHRLDDGTLYPANGLLVEDGRGSVLVDTAWEPEQAEALLRWAKGLGRPVRSALITHAHGDRSGGIQALRRHRIPVLAGSGTILKLPGSALQELRFQEGTPAPIPGGLQVLFPGPGHAPDNLVVYHPATGVLFGGCLLKDRDAEGLGNLAEANLARWPGAVRAVKAAFPEAKLQVPGHGPAGGDAEARTLALLEAAQP